MPPVAPPLDPEPHHLRTLGETAFGLGGFAVGYWTLRATQQPDWDYPSLSGRFDGSAWRFDNNQLIINYWLHPLAGGEMYALARANHHGPWAAAGYSTLGSFLWEFVFEYRELVSVNDLLATSFPGVAIGEFLHKLGVYLDSAERPSGALSAARWTLSPGVRFDRWLDGTTGADVPLRDELGLRADLWHDFRTSFEAGSALADAQELGTGRLRFQGRLVSLPGYRTPGRSARAFHDVDFSSLELGIEASQAGPGLETNAEALLFGWHARDYAARSRAVVDDLPGLPLTGSSVTVGGALAYSYLESFASGFGERLGAFHILGPKLELGSESRFARTTLELRATPDFVGVGAYGYEDWQALHPRELGKHILRNQDYFYGWGGSGLAKASVAMGALALSGSVFYGSWRSQEGLNRWQERVTLDVPAGSELLRYRLSADARLGRSPLSVGVALEVRRWNTFIGELRRSKESLLRGAELRYSF